MMMQEWGFEEWFLWQNFENFLKQERAWMENPSQNFEYNSGKFIFFKITMTKCFCLQKNSCLMSSDIHGQSFGSYFFCGSNWWLNKKIFEERFFRQNPWKNPTTFIVSKNIMRQEKKLWRTYREKFSPKTRENHRFQE